MDTEAQKLSFDVLAEFKRQQQVTFEDNQRTLQKVIEQLNQIQKVRIEPYSYMETLFDRQSTTGQVRPDAPTISLKNPQDNRIRVLSIILTPDANFKTKGVVIVRVNGVTIFSQNVAGKFTDTSEIKISIPENGLAFRAGQSVEVFFWNGVDATAVVLTTNVLVGDYI